MGTKAEATVLPWSSWGSAYRTMKQRVMMGTKGEAIVLPKPGLRQCVCAYRTLIGGL